MKVDVSDGSLRKVTLFFKDKLTSFATFAHIWRSSFLLSAPGAALVRLEFTTSLHRDPITEKQNL